MSLYSEKLSLTNVSKKSGAKFSFRKDTLKGLITITRSPLPKSKNKNTSAGKCHKENKNEEQTKKEVIRFETVFWALQKRGGFSNET